MPGVSKNLGEAIRFLGTSFENLSGAAENFVWSAARDEFVENFAKLANKSQMQVGHHSNVSFKDLAEFVQSLVAKDTVY